MPQRKGTLTLSLYPAVNKYDKYPVGHPSVICSNFKDIQQYFGLVKVKITPPRNLYHPVLSCQINKKLMFLLCKTCAEMEHNEPCVCHGDARTLVGCWTTPELQKAVELGNTIQIYKVYHWDKTAQYKPSTAKGIFLQKRFLKLKQMESGWPTKLNITLHYDLYSAYIPKCFTD